MRYIFHNNKFKILNQGKKLGFTQNKVLLFNQTAMLVLYIYSVISPKDQISNINNFSVNLDDLARTVLSSLKGFEIESLDLDF